MAKNKRVVKSVIVIDDDGSGGRRRTVVARRSRRKKRGSAGLREVQKLVRRIVRAEESFASSYLARHDRSNRRRKDGWLRDILANVARAIAPASRKLTR